MKHAIPKHAAQLILAVGFLALQSCAAWNSAPARTRADYGLSVRNMVNNQIYTPARAQYPAAVAPAGMEGNKADGNDTGKGILKSYREDIGDPNWVRQHTLLGTPGGFGAGASGGGGGMR